ncbi:MAG: DUF975 family protein [Clostridiales bacterium]|nr:DUF975 family protein [Clostridiales bacterium]
MNLREIKKTALKNLGILFKYHKIVFIIYITEAVIFNLIPAVMFLTQTFEWVFFPCVLVWIASVRIIGQLDLEKAYFFNSLSEGRNTDEFTMSEIGGRLSESPYKNILNSCLLKYFYVVGTFFIFAFFIILILWAKIEETVVLMDNPNINFANKYNFIVLGDLLFFCHFLVLIIKSFFVEYIAADKFRELREGTKNPKENKYKRYDKNVLFDDTNTGKLIIKENNRLVSADRLKMLSFTLSFSGWFLLSLITLGFGFAFFIPYFDSAKALLYKEFKTKNSIS